MPIGAAPDHVEGEVVRGEFDLTVAKVNLAAFKLGFHHQDALSASDPDLEGTHLREPELPSSLQRKLRRYVADAICERKAIPLDVWHVEDDFVWEHGADKPRSGEALALARKLLQHVLLLAEIAHVGLDLRLCQL